MAATGSLVLPIPNVSQLNEIVSSPVQTIATLPWRLFANKECSQLTGGVEALSVYIGYGYHPESTTTSALWSSDMDVEFRLCLQTDSTEPFSRQLSVILNFQIHDNKFGFRSFIKMSDVLEASRGFVKNDQVLVVAHVQVKNFVKTRPAFDDFTRPFAVANRSDNCAIVIGATRLHVNKAYLAEYSPVFTAMFFGEFCERNLREVPINDVAVEEFTDLLHVIYPSHKRIDADNCEYLLALADRFDVPYVMDECETFLLHTDQVRLPTKLVCADKYALPELQDACVRVVQMTSGVDIKALRSTREYEKLSDANKVALLEKLFK